jgi:hypothetical protein
MVQAEAEVTDYGFILQGLRHAIDNLELDFARYAALFAEGDEWGSAGFNTAGDWIRINCHMNSNAVWNALTVGEQTASLPESLKAMKAREIGFAHLATLANTADKLKGFDESVLLPVAKEHSPGKFFHKVRHYRHAVDAKAYNREQEELAEERYLHLSTAVDGCLLIGGVLDPVRGAEVRSALEPLAQPSGDHDHRSRDVRLADALHERVTGAAPVTLQVTATLETLKGLVGSAAGEMEFSVPLSKDSVRRIACDCKVTRVLLNQESLVIDVGRSRRVVDGALRKALAVRDKYCRWPNCERPASWCDGHHLVHWVDGGETSLDNCVLLCKRHHRMVHEGGWKLVKAEGKIVAIAPVMTFGLPRGPD